jgi:hypothetical protein
MSIDKDLIHRLTLEELAEVISDEDLVYLKTTIREHSEAFNIWIETRSVLNTPDVKAFLARSRPIEDIFLTSHPPKIPDFWTFALSIAILLIVSLSLYLVFRPEPVASLVNSKNVRVQFPDEKNISLTQQQRLVKIDKAP